MKLTGLLWAFVWLTACSAPYTSQRSTLTTKEIPLKTHQEEIQFYFEGDASPQRPHIKAMIVEVVGGAGESYDALSKRLKNQAQQKGLNAIIDIKRSHRTEDNRNLLEVLSDDEPQLFGANVLSGIGIVFLDQLTYLEQRVKQERFFLVDQSEEMKVAQATASFDLFRSLQRLDGDGGYYEQHVLPFRLEELIEGEEHWQYQRDYQGRIHKRTLKANGIAEKKCRLLYEGNTLTGLELKIFRISSTFRYNIYLAYNADGQLIEKLIVAKDGQRWKEVLHHDDQGRLIQRDHFLENGGEWIAVGTSVLTYYTKSDLSNMLQLSAMDTGL